MVEGKDVQNLVLNNRIQNKMAKKIKISYKTYFEDIKKRESFGRLTSNDFNAFFKKILRYFNL